MWYGYLITICFDFTFSCLLATAASLPTLALQGGRDTVLCVVTVCPSVECCRCGDVCGNDELVPSPSSHGTGSGWGWAPRLSPWRRRSCGSCRVSPLYPRHQARDLTPACINVKRGHEHRHVSRKSDTKIRNCLMMGFNDTRHSAMTWECADEVLARVVFIVSWS